MSSFPTLCFLHFLEDCFPFCPLVPSIFLENDSAFLFQVPFSYLPILCHFLVLKLLSLQPHSFRFFVTLPVLPVMVPRSLPATMVSALFSLLPCINLLSFVVVVFIWSHRPEEGVIVVWRQRFLMFAFTPADHLPPWSWNQCIHGKHKNKQPKIVHNSVLSVNCLMTGMTIVASKLQLVLFNLFIHDLK